MTDDEKMARIDEVIGKPRHDKHLVVFDSTPTNDSSVFRTATECAVADAVEQRARSESLLMFSEPGMAAESCRSLGVTLPARSLKPGSRVNAFGCATPISVGRSQHVDVASYALRHMRLSLLAYDTRRAIREAGKAHNGAYFGVLRRAISDIVAANNVFAAMQATNLIRALSTRRGMKVARKAKLDVNALRKVADKWSATRQPTLAITDTAAYANIKQSLSHGTTITVTSSDAS